MTTTKQTLSLLRRFESRNITHIDPDGSWPIVWQRARGVNVWDAEERQYLDLTAAFGVMATGHGNPRVVRAGQRQLARLTHAMGDVHPHGLKAELARELSRLTFERWGGSNRKSKIEKRKWGVTIFCNSGFEAVEAALKTALLATERPGVIAFEGAYHGTGYGALNATHRRHFRGPFQSQMGEFGHFVPFPQSARELPAVERTLHDLLRRHRIGAVLAEPVQGRGGIRVPPAGFLRLLRKLCDRYGALLVLDEIYTGFGRTGKWFACEHSGAVPDLICLGKAMAGGFPLSACVGRVDVMDKAWPESQGEAIHTSTFLGHPVGCAMALAQIAEIHRKKLVERSARLGRLLRRFLETEISDLKSSITVRGLGLMAGLEFREPNGAPATGRVLAVVKAMLTRGFILLPEGEHGNVISLTPPLIITEAQLRRTVRTLGEELRRLS